MLHARIAQAIRTARQGRLSAQQLADETERLGYGISRSQIANYESGRKKSLDVADLFVIAAALGVPPASFTGGPGHIWPGREVAELTEKLNRMDDIMKSTAAAFAGASLVTIPAPTAEADVKSKEETK